MVSVFTMCFTTYLILKVSSINIVPYTNICRPDFLMLPSLTIPDCSSHFKHQAFGWFTVIFYCCKTLQIFCTRRKLYDLIKHSLSCKIYALYLSASRLILCLFSDKMYYSSPAGTASSSFLINFTRISVVSSPRSTSWRKLISTSIWTWQEESIHKW